MLKKIGIAFALLIVALGTFYVAAVEGWFGEHLGPGQITQVARPADAVAAIQAQQDITKAALDTPAEKQVLFGDLHVHTTFSTDAFTGSLPMLGGEGAHPPADACDFARFCSQLDFWSINDHAENLPHQNWREIVDTIRQCNATAGDPANPDTVAYLGWEWTQVGTVPNEHYGHKNVVLRDLDADKIPARPIASGGRTAQALSAPPYVALLAVVLGRDKPYLDATKFLAERRDLTRCDETKAERDMAPDCYEDAATPADLYAKLNDWGHESIVIPHGTTWGFYTPPGATWDKQLKGNMHDPARQTLVELYSGHGNSEEYRPWRAAGFIDASDPLTAYCPAPTEGYLSTCWRAGEIIKGRCLEAGESNETCEARAAEARLSSARAGAAGRLVVPGNTAEEWLNAGQCDDCFQPSFNFRPGSSVQYMMAISNFDEGGKPRRFRFGFIGSSDNHTARPGTGFKEVNRKHYLDGFGADSEEVANAIRVDEPKAAQAKVFNSVQEVFEAAPNTFQILDTERQSSFFLTGGLIAAHSDGRDRDAIWDAMQRREVYATSGPRILLWFDLLNAPQGEVAMGGETEMGNAPHFRVRAAGSFKQKPGCPDYASEALGPERMAHVCANECYNPSDERRLIERIEIIRIRPQTSPTEDVVNLIDDPWQVFECTPNQNGCTAEFTDPDFTAAARDTLYYARAVEEQSPVINADNLRCERDGEGNCIAVTPCYGDYRVSRSEECTAMSGQRAWSSPIFVDYKAPVIVEEVIEARAE